MPTSARPTFVAEHVGPMRWTTVGSDEMAGDGRTVQATLRGDGVLEVVLDDGGPNVLRPDVLDALREAFLAHPEAPVLLRGREGMFSAGLDLRWMVAHSPEEIGGLLRACGRALMTVWTHPRPVVAAATGHAIAAGTMLAMSCDHVVAAEGGAWGLNETTNGMEIPRFGIDLAAARLGPRDLDALLIPGERIDAARAAAVGMADVLCAPADVLPRAEARLSELAALPAAAYAGNKLRLRGRSAERVLEELDADVASLVDGLARTGS
jgi:enoyl-CoA hydratase